MNPQIVTGEGSLNYDMIISGGDLGGITEVKLTPLHSFNQITPRSEYYVICSVRFEYLYQC